MDRIFSIHSRGRAKEPAPFSCNDVNGHVYVVASSAEGALEKTKSYLAAYGYDLVNAHVDVITSQFMNPNAILLFEGE